MAVHEETTVRNRVEVREITKLLGASEDPRFGDLQPLASEEDGRKGDPLKGQGGMGATNLETTTRPAPTMGSDGYN